MDITQFNDQQLLESAMNLIGQEQKLLSKILMHLQEIERRKLYCDLGYSSLYDYCLKELRYSPQQAWRRINAMRLMKKLPELINSIDDGTLTLSSINLASNLFKEAKIDNKADQLQIISGMKMATQIECENKIFQIKEKLGILNPLKNDVINRTTSDTYRLHVNLKKETLEKLQKVKNLMKEDDMDKILSSLMDNFIIQKIESKRETKNKRAIHSRYIPRKVKEIVYKRANGKCENCFSMDRLEYEHKIPFAKGGSNEASNIQLFCSNCNKRKAIKDFGLNKMNYYLSSYS